MAQLTIGGKTVSAISIAGKNVQTINIGGKDFNFAPPSFWPTWAPGEYWGWEFERYRQDRDIAGHFGHWESRKGELGESNGTSTRGVSSIDWDTYKGWGIQAHIRGNHGLDQIIVFKIDKSIDYSHKADLYRVNNHPVTYHWNGSDALLSVNIDSGLNDNNIYTCALHDLKLVRV